MTANKNVNKCVSLLIWVLKCGLTFVSRFIPLSCVHRPVLQRYIYNLLFQRSNSRNDRLNPWKNWSNFRQDDLNSRKEKSNSRKGSSNCRKDDTLAAFFVSVLGVKNDTLFTEMKDSYQKWTACIYTVMKLQRNINETYIVIKN